MSRALPWRSPMALFYATATIAALSALLCVYEWARRNTTVADAQHERLIVATALCLAAIGAVAVMLALAGAGDDGWPAIIRAGAAGAFVAVAASAASTMLIAMAIAPATDPGDFGRPLFRVAYIGALVISAAAGADAAWTAGNGSAVRRAAQVGITVALIGGAWAYLAVGSAELNQCVVNDEFPLATEHVCSGY